MKVPTTRFGELEVPEDAVYRFPTGILGFASIELYFILNNPKGGPFQWLQAVDPPSLAFVVCDPTLFKPDYRVRARPEDLASIELDDASQGIVLVILTVPKDPLKITANLQGPIVFNTQKRLAKQLVLADAQYSTKHPIFEDAPEAEPAGGVANRGSESESTEAQ